MAFPVTINRAQPADGDTPAEGDDQFRTLKTQLQDLFGLPDNTNITAAILSLGALTDGKIATAPVLKGASPLHGRVIGTEGSAVDLSWQEDAGVLKLRKNTGTEAVPVWTTVFQIDLATGNLAWFSGTSFKATLDHALGADRTFTFPDATGTFALLEAVNAFTKTQRWAKGADLASGATLTPGTDGNYFDVTGTTTITAIASAAAGTIIALQFDGILQITHNATTLILPGGANITTAAGDVLVFISEGAGNWRLATRSAVSNDHTADRTSVGSRTLAAGKVIVPAAVSGTPAAHGLYRENVVKAWGSVDYSAGVPTLVQHFNVSGITDVGAGFLGVTFDRDFADDDYAPLAIANSSGNLYAHIEAGTKLVGSVQFEFCNENGASTDPTEGAAMIACGNH